MAEPARSKPEEGQKEEERKLEPAGPPAQTCWVDQQGNVYYASGFTPEHTNKPATAAAAQQHDAATGPMSIPAANPYSSYPGNGCTQEWAQSQVYAEPQFYYGGGYYYGQELYPHAGLYYPTVDPTADGTPPGSPHGSPAQSPVNSPGHSLEMMRAFGQHAELFTPMMQQPQTAWAEVKHHVVALSKTRTGSVAIQWHLEHCSPEVFDEILHEMLGSISGLINDRYGSHVTRQLVERCDPAQRLLIWQDIEDSLVKVACTRSGTWTVQALLDAVKLDSGEQLLTNSEHLDALKKALPEESIVKLMKDQHGGHMIARCAQKLPDEHGLFVFEAAANNLNTLCKHKYGCTTLQRMLESADEAASVLMAREVSKMGFSISKDQYGNYIVQHVLGLELASCLEARTKLFDSLKGHFFSLSTHKYGSNIVEKCLKMGDAERSAVIAELTKTAGDSDSENDRTHGSACSSLEQLIVHPYGNYVAQSALILCSDEELDLFRSRLEAFAEASDKECDAQLAVAEAQAAAGTNGSGSGSSTRAHTAVEPFRKTVHGRKILQKLHMRSNKDKLAAVAGGGASRTSSTVGVGPVTVSVIDVQVAGGSSDALGSHTGAAGASHQQKRGQPNGGAGKGSQGRGRATSQRGRNNKWKQQDQPKYGQQPVHAWDAERYVG